MLLDIFRLAKRPGVAQQSSVIATAIAMLTVSCAARAQATSSVRSATYLYMRGADTIGSETLHVTDTSALGDLTIKGLPRISWAQHRSGTSVGTLRLQVFTPSSAAGAAPQTEAIVFMRNDSAIVDVLSGGKTATQRFKSSVTAVPLVNSSVLHQVLLGANAQRLKSSSIDYFLTAGAQTVTGAVAQHGDTLVLRLAGSETRATFGASGLPDVVTTSQNVRVVLARSPILLSTMNYDAPAGAPYSAEHVRIPSGRGYMLAATLTMPKGLNKAPALITISGSGPQERDSRISLIPGYAFFREVADTLGRRGIAVLRFDDRGVGESGGRESAAKATSADFADDVRSIVTWLRARPDIDGSRILLAGHSEGGMIAPMVAASDPQVRGIALMAGPAYSGRRISLFQNRQTVDGIASLTPKQRDSIMTRVPAALDSAGNANPWLGYFFSHDPLVTARQVKQPVLILQGLTDRQVSPEQADTLAVALRKAGNKVVTLRTFPATNHLFLPDSSGASTGYGALPDTHVRPAVLSALAEWATKVLK